MNEQKKYISMLNLLIKDTENKDFKDLLPFSIEKLQHNKILCEAIIDYLGDIYVCKGLDENYCETQYGNLISQVIGFLAQCNI